MRTGDLVQWNYGSWSLIGILIKKSGHFGWEVYFSKNNSISTMETSALIKLQQVTAGK